MRHQIRGNALGRTQSERRALMRGLAIGLITHGKVRTTVAKAKALRPFIEPLVTRAKKDTLSNRRIIASRIPNPGVVKKLFADYGPRYAARSGGYTRVIKVSGFRRGDSAEVAEVRWV
ncbi:MAG: 50S ribosomal protein L17 [Candidatus Hydrogenedentota bacterium]